MLASLTSGQLESHSLTNWNQIRFRPRQIRSRTGRWGSDRGREDEWKYLTEEGAYRMDTANPHAAVCG